jgi:hypothetical protein
MIWFSKLFASIIIILSLTSPAVGNTGSNPIFLPIISSVNNQASVSAFNVPYFNVPDVIYQKGAEMGIFWFGKVTPDQAYADIRLGYNDSELDLRAQIFDRRLWYDQNANPTDMTKWDSIAITLQTSNPNSVKPSTTSYKFLAGLYFWEEANPYKKGYQGNGTGWVEKNLSFTTLKSWRGDAPNNNIDDRGWSMEFRIPFATLGLTGKPPTGTIWKMGVTLYDRNGLNISPAPTTYWPENSNDSSPNTWGNLRFGIPHYTPLPTSNVRTTIIRQGLNGAVVKDGAVGGGTICGDGLDFFGEWGSANYNNYTYFNIQNQIDVADWPCFSKYYVTFPIGQIPAGKVIKSAQLSLFQFGGSDPSQAYPSLVQVMTINKDWDQATLTWNNAPQELENVSQAWVNPITSFTWPGVEIKWDVSRAVDLAYGSGNPVRLVLYSADFEYHSGKYFTTSEAEDWDAAGRPTLTIQWGDLVK